MVMNNSIKEQVRRNMVALISDHLENSRAAAEAIIAAINVVRADALALLQELD